MMMYMRFPDGKKKALTFSYDDGPQQDIRFMEMLNRYELKGTFNLNGIRFEKEEYVRSALETYGGELGRNHEVAIHSYSHPYLDRIPRDIATYEVIKDREQLEKSFGRVIRGCAYPMGTFNDTTVEILRNCGIVYARTTVGTGNFAVPTDWLRMPSTCHHNDERLFTLANTFINDQPSVWGNNPWLFYVWGHTFEFNTEEKWNRMETFCEQVSRRDDVWYATNIEIYDYVQAYNALQFSMDFSRVRNPSALTVWFDFDGASAVVLPGETKKFR